MKNHRDTIITTTIQPKVSAWHILFNDWALLVDNEEDVSYCSAIDAVKAAQTLVPRKTHPSADFSSNTFVCPPQYDSLDLYEKVWLAPGGFC